jgi:hypothetical protein
VTATPSIKGAAFSNIAGGVLKLVASGRLSREELAKRLEPGDLEVIEGPISTAEWYDIRIHVRLLRVLDAAGGPGYLREVLETSADRLLASGLYQQLGYLSRTQVERERDPSRRITAFAKDLRLVVTLSSAMLNFGRWEAKPDPDWQDRYMIEITHAEEFRDIHLSSIEIVINRISTQFASGGLWRWERKGPDHVVFRMTRGVADL